MWPVHDLDRDLAFAADRLEEISRLGEIAESPELVDEIREEIQELRSRIKSSERRQPPPAKWWQFWK
jgi:hypothetical protein